MEDGYAIRRLQLSHASEKKRLCTFLQSHGLRYEENIEVAFGIIKGEEEEELCGCGCAAGALLKCFAVEESLRGQNALGSLISALVQERFSKGFSALSVITRRKNEALFSSCGFFPVVHTEALMLLENSPDGPERFARPFLKEGDAARHIGAIVMNANPFTLGHRALAEYAAAHCEVLHIFVVQEDRSQFPFAARLRLVEEGTADLPGVRVHPSGPYIISGATFPTYFLKKDEDVVSLQSELDVTLFAERIAPVLHITRRFVGEEPLDAVTARYNAAMARILPAHGMELVAIPRAVLGNEVISASRVRTLLREGKTDAALQLVPETTQRFLMTWQEGSHESS